MQLALENEQRTCCESAELLVQLVSTIGDSRMARYVLKRRCRLHGTETEQWDVEYFEHEGSTKARANPRRR